MSDRPAGAGIPSRGDEGRHDASVRHRLHDQGASRGQGVIDWLTSLAEEGEHDATPVIGTGVFGNANRWSGCGVCA